MIVVFNNEDEIEKVDFHGKVMGYSDLEELEDASPVIVRGTKKKENSVEVFRSKANNEVIGGYTESSFVISEVYKNSEGRKDVEHGNEIRISEMAFYDEETKAIYTVNDYENMEFDEEYLLFLVPVDNGMYSPRGVTFGKVIMSESVLNQNRSLSEGVDTDVVVNIAKEAQKKYREK